MTNLELARRYIQDHNANERWSPFDGPEWRAIEMFANWLDSRNSDEPSVELPATLTPEQAEKIADPRSPIGWARDHYK
ncbi:MAG TPA: hypothetical protein VFA81_05775 [Burkholderiales bacterium]|jgi:hypothetical protein|nr:hypothetical protein [Burkholderiales bacterium]